MRTGRRQAVPEPLAPGRPTEGGRLLADVGGTHARFAWQDEAGATLRAVQVRACAEHASLLDAVRHYVASQALPRPRQAAIGIATPVLGDQVQMTNHHWSFSVTALRHALGLDRLRVLNDFTALALAVPQLPAALLTPIGHGEVEAHAPKALIGPGTGLGVSGLVWHGGGWIPLHTEGGHVSFSPCSAREWALWEWLQRRHGHVSAERVVSGPGLASVYQGLAAIDGAGVEPLPASALDAAALGGDARAEEALALFLAVLGTTAGNLALSLGARGGVYLGGGMLPRLRHRLAGSALRARFDDTGRMGSYLARIALLLIDAPESPALLGAAAALELPAG